MRAAPRLNTAGIEAVADNQCVDTTYSYPFSSTFSAFQGTDFVAAPSTTGNLPTPYVGAGLCFSSAGGTQNYAGVDKVDCAGLPLPSVPIVWAGSFLTELQCLTPYDVVNVNGTFVYLQPCGTAATPTPSAAQMWQWADLPGNLLQYALQHAASGLCVSAQPLSAAGGNTNLTLGVCDDASASSTTDTFTMGSATVLKGHAHQPYPANVTYGVVVLEGLYVQAQVGTSADLWLSTCMSSAPPTAGPPPQLQSPPAQPAVMPSPPLLPPPPRPPPPRPLPPPQPPPAPPQPPPAPPAYAAGSTFTVSSTASLSGMSSASFGATESSAFTTTLASTLQVDSADVTITRVADTPSSARHLLQAAPSVDVDFTVATSSSPEALASRVSTVTTNPAAFVGALKSAGLAVTGVAVKPPQVVAQPPLVSRNFTSQVAQQSYLSNVISNASLLSSSAAVALVNSAAAALNDASSPLHENATAAAAIRSSLLTAMASSAANVSSAAALQSVASTVSALVSNASQINGEGASTALTILAAVSSASSTGSVAVNNATSHSVVNSLSSIVSAALAPNNTLQPTVLTTVMSIVDSLATTHLSNLAAGDPGVTVSSPAIQVRAAAVCYMTVLWLTATITPVF